MEEKIKKQEMIGFELVKRGEKVGSNNNKTIPTGELRRVIEQLGLSRVKEVLLQKSWITQREYEDSELIKHAYENNVDTLWAIADILVKSGEDVFDGYSTVVKVLPSEKVEIEMIRELIGSEQDDDQVMRQGANEEEKVSLFKVYRDNEVFCYFGSMTVGEQEVYYRESEDGEPIPMEEDNGSIELIEDDPMLLLKVMTLQKEKGIEYLDWQANSWLEAYYLDEEKNDISFKTEQMAANSEDFIHGGILDFTFLGEELISDIQKAKAIK